MKKEISLAVLENEKTGVIERVDGGIQLAARLNSMGLFPGRKIKKKSSGTKGPVLIELLGSKLAIGRGMAEKIIVRPDTD